MSRSMPQTEPPLQQSTGELLLAVADDLRAVFQRACDDLGLTFMETTALRHAARHRAQAAIVEELGLTPTRVSGLLGALERKDLVRRIRARGDQRQRIVELTERGASAVDQLNLHLERESPLLRRLDDDQRDALRALLLQLLDESPG